MTHKHHIIPKHAGGTNESTNIIELSISDHAKAHKLLFLQHGRLRDKLAWKMLAGKTDEAEQIRIILAKEGSQKFLSDPCRKRDWCQKISKSLTGRQQSQETRLKRSMSLKIAYKNTQLHQK